MSRLKSTLGLFAFLYAFCIGNAYSQTCSSVVPQAASTTATSGTFSIYAYGVNGAMTSVLFPTWGQAGGQDDLVWYAGVNQGGGTWRADINLANHKAGAPEFGTFDTHVYAYTAGGQSSFCGNTTWSRVQPSPPGCTSAGPNGASTNATSGTFSLYAYGVNSSTSRVVFPTWGEPGGQDDLVWYEGADQGGGTWRADVNLANHKAGNPEFGTFDTHVYAYSPDGQSTLCAALTWSRVQQQQNVPPLGSVNGVTAGGTAYGTAYDPNTPSQSISVHLYTDGEAGVGGTIVAGVPTNPGDRSFSFNLPASFHDGRVHTIYAYGIDSAGGPNTLLAGSPFVFMWGNPPAPAPETVNGALWMAPSHVGVAANGSNVVITGLRQEVRDMFLYENLWPETRAKVKVFKFYATSFLPNPSFPDDDAFLRDIIIPKLRQWGMKVAVEVRGAKERQCFGNTATLAGDAAMIDKFRGFGGNVDFLVLDSAIEQNVYSPTCTVTTDETIGYVIDYVRYMKQRYPGIRIGFTDALPWRASGHQPNFNSTMLKLVTRLSANGLELDFFQGDYPYNYSHIPAHGGWTFIKGVESYVRGTLRMPFALVYNSESGDPTYGNENGGGNVGSNHQFYLDTLAAYTEYRNAGGLPDNYVVQSWYRYPNPNIPEASTTDYPLTRTVRDFGRLLP